MMHRTRTVIVKHLPAKIDRQGERAFLREIAFAMNVERPAIVIDCSQAHDMNSTAIHALLCCLEQAMKRNGDVRLAGLSPQAMENLCLMSVDRLFRIFDTTERAIESFQRRSVFMPSFAVPALVTEHAA